MASKSRLLSIEDFSKLIVDIGHSGSIYTTEIDKCDKTGLGLGELAYENTNGYGL